MLSHELVVVERFMQNYADHAGEDGGVLTGAGLQMNGCAAGCFRGSGVNHNQLHAPLYRFLELLRGVLAGNTGSLGYDGIHTNKQPGIGVLEVLVPAPPNSVQRLRNLLVRLVDGVGSKEHGGAERSQQGVGGHRAARVGQGVGAAVDGDRSGAMFLDQRVKLCGDLLGCRCAGYRLQRACGISFLAAEQALRVVVQFREGAPFGAGVAFEQWVLRVSGDVGELSLLDRGEDAAVGDAQAADAGAGVLCLRGGGLGRLGHRGGLGCLVLIVSQGS